MFTNIKDKELYVSFYVFKVENLASNFSENLEKWNMMQSCAISIHLEKKNAHLVSIPVSFGDHYYLLNLAENVI